jgi:CBS domain-containing protein
MAPSRIEGSYRIPSFENARVSEAMHPGVVSSTPETSLRALAQTMAQHHIHSVVITGLAESSQQGWGLVTDVDLLRAAGGDLDTREARDIAHTDAPVVSPDDTLARAAELMAEQRTSHLIVVDHGDAVGVLSSLDVAGILAWGRA